jgi:innexin
MFGIPFLPHYIKSIVKLQSVADSVDWLNYYCSSLMLAFFALAISAKQYFGTPINCWTPNEFKGGWEKYAENYCFISNSYYVPFDSEVPTELSQREDRISYYRVSSGEEWVINV